MQHTPNQTERWKVRKIERKNRKLGRLIPGFLKAFFAFEPI